jgi:hypothetical protein
MNDLLTYGISLLSTFIQFQFFWIVTFQRSSLIKQDNLASFHIFRLKVIGISFYIGEFFLRKPFSSHLNGSFLCWCAHACIGWWDESFCLRIWDADVLFWVFNFQYIFVLLIQTSGLRTGHWWYLAFKINLRITCSRLWRVTQSRERTESLNSVREEVDCFRTTNLLFPIGWNLTHHTTTFSWSWFRKWLAWQLNLPSE